VISNFPTILKLWTISAQLIYRIFGWRKKAAIESKIESHLNNMIHQLSMESPIAFDKGFRLKWISSGKDVASLKDGTVIVRIKDDVNAGKPFVTATLLYLEEGVIKNSRPFIDNRLMHAIDLVLAHRMIETCPYPDAINILTNDHINPALDEKEIASYYEESDAIDRAGLLTRVVIKEYSSYSSKLVGRRPTRTIRNESVNFFRFVGRLIDRESDVPLRFFGSFIRCTLALIAKTEVFEQSGLSVYQHNFQRDIDLGVQVIYLLARGKRNVEVARYIAKWATDQNLVSGAIPDRYLQTNETGEPVPTECIACLSARVRTAMELSPLEEVQVAISHYIPETLTGEVDILSVAREPGIITKVMVHSDSQSDPVSICMGGKRERLHLISQELLKGEVIDFINWSPDPRENVVSALTPLDPMDVLSVRMSSNGLSAIILVRSSAAAQRAVGKDGVNVRVASRLLSMNIELETNKGPISPEEIVRAVLAYRIPEIESGKISIVRISRRVGRLCKVAIQSQQVNNLYRVCIGTGGNIVKAISADLNNEQVTFVFWNQKEIERCIIEALYPLRREQVKSVDVDKKNNKAVVIVNSSEDCRLAIGKDGDNVRLAQEICELRIDIRKS
jgi:transcription antitermination factor NusA-like protein